MSRMYQPLRTCEVQPGAEIGVREATALDPDPVRAVSDLRVSLAVDAPSLILFFCAPTYDRDALATALNDAFGHVPLVGCTTAGQLDGAGYRRGGITALALSSTELDVSIVPVTPLSQLATGSIALAERLTKRKRKPGWRTCALTLIDGMSHQEEVLTSAVHETLHDMPLVGGSAGDDLRHAGTAVFVDGEFKQDAAAVVLLHTTLELRTFQFHHFEPGNKVLVITDADPARRTVAEINGESAAREYARAVGVPIDALSPRVFADHPLLLNIGGDYIARSIRSALPDGSLTFYCAIEGGLVTRVGRAVDVVETTRRAFDRVVRDLGEVSAVIGCESALRRLSYEEHGIDREIGNIYAAHHVVGFSGYGEQFNGIHTNHTFTGIALGRPR